MESTAPTIHIVDDDPEIRLLLGAWLEAEGYAVKAFGSGQDYLSHSEPAPDLVCLDLRMPGMDGLALLHHLRDRGEVYRAVILTADDDVATAVECMKQGAFDFQVKPIHRERFLKVVEAGIRPARAERRPAAPALTRHPPMLGRSSALDRVRGEVAKVADTNITVFIHGESGTGKELVARSIHTSSPRSSAPFVALNCGAIPDTLQESVLFGHEKGAFTGATETRKGKFELADGGTLLLDEVAELSATAQVRLLRVLQERHVERVGGTVSVPVDVRVVSATHRNLQAMVASGTFRQDLYYRLVIYPIEVPPLRDRPEDVRALFEHYLTTRAREIGVEPPEICDDVWPALRAYPWPGNIRELANVAHRCVVAHRGSVVRARGLGLETALPEQPDSPSTSPPATTSAEATPAATTMEDAERRALRDALAACNGNVTAASKRLKIGRATLYRKLSRYSLSRDGS